MFGVGGLTPTGWWTIVWCMADNGLGLGYWIVGGFQAFLVLVQGADDYWMADKWLVLRG